MAFMPKGSELLIFLDGENTDSRVLDWARSKSCVKVFSSKTPLGISGALNALIEESQGEVIARMDADDISLPGRFSKGVKLVSRGLEDFVFTNMILFGLAVKPIGFLPHLPVGVDNEQAKWLLWLGNPFAHPTMIARRSVIVSLGAYRKSISEDYDLWLRAAAAGYRFRRLKRHGLLYRLHPAQLTKQKYFESMNKSDALLSESRQAFSERLRGGQSDLSEEALHSIALRFLVGSPSCLSLQIRLSNWRRKNRHRKQSDTSQQK
jgi:glycosyltransferase involved in cell wall biosynthesis